MNILEIIEKKKMGKALTKEEIHYWIEGYCKDLIKDYQVSALLMAICLKGMNDEECCYLCEEMINSGDIIDLSEIDGIICDKHSTGGVGDKTSLVLVPLLASVGVKVAKMSGRGLGHTGGTLDKLESIEGFKIQLSKEEFISQVNQVGASIISQSKDLVLADQKLYALRDVTGTVNSIPLIASSIMSKKIASGSDVILLDVKVGDGAFMKTLEDARKLGNTMIKIGQHFHKKVRVMITNMDQPLGNAIGNWIEVQEAINTLKNQGPNDLKQLCIQAASILMKEAQVVNDEENAMHLLNEVLSSGIAFHKFIEMVEAQHGNIHCIIHSDEYGKSKFQTEIIAKQSGTIQKIDTQNLGLCAMKLGAGRTCKEDIINPNVGILLNKKTYDMIQSGDVMATIYHDQVLDEEWIQDFYQCFHMGEAISKQPLIYEII